MLIQVRDVCNGHIGKFPDVHAIATGDTLQEEVIGFAFGRNASDPFSHGRKIVALFSLRIDAQQFHVDPECLVEDDSQLPCQFRSLTLSETRRQVTEIQVFGGLNIISVLRR